MSGPDRLLLEVAAACGSALGEFDAMAAILEEAADDRVVLEALGRAECRAFARRVRDKLVETLAECRRIGDGSIAPAIARPGRGQAALTRELQDEIDAFEAEAARVVEDRIEPALARISGGDA